MIRPLDHAHSPGIYAITHVASGKQYIGSAVKVRARLYIHKSMLKRGAHHNEPLQRAWNKYGADAFEAQTLECVGDRCELIAREQFWIDSQDTCNKSRGYNVAPRAGAPVGRKGVIVSAATREKMRANGLKQTPNVSGLVRYWAENPGKKHTPEHSAAISAAKKGKKFSASHISAMSAARVGKKQSEETKAKKSASLKASYTPERRAAVSALHTGRKRSDECRARLSAAQAAHQAKLRAAQRPGWMTVEQARERRLMLQRERRRAKSSAKNLQQAGYDC